MVFDHSKLRGRIIEKYGTIGAFADDFGIARPLMSRKLNNEIGFSRQEILRCGMLLGFDSSEYGKYFFTEKVQDVRLSENKETHHA